MKVRGGREGEGDGVRVAPRNIAEQLAESTGYTRAAGGLNEGSSIGGLVLDLVGSGIIDLQSLTGPFAL